MHQSKSKAMKTKHKYASPEEITKHGLLDFGQTNNPFSEYLLTTTNQEGEEELYTIGANWFERPSHFRWECPELGTEADSLEDLIQSILIKLLQSD
jgi:hypothetical protein